MVVDQDVLIVDQDLEETRGSMAGRVTQEWGPRVQAELAGDSSRNKRPGSVNVSAAIKVGPDRPQPVPQRLGVDQVLGSQVAMIVDRCIDRIVTGDDQPADGSSRRADQLPGSFQLPMRQPPSGGEAGSRGIKPEDRRLRVEEAEPGILQRRGELAKEMLKPAVPMCPNGVPVVIAREDRRLFRILQPGPRALCEPLGTQRAEQWWSGRR